jgi:hypothetical protein
MNIWQDSGSASILRQAEDIAKSILAKNANDIGRNAAWPEEGLSTLVAEEVAEDLEVWSFHSATAAKV